MIKNDLNKQEKLLLNNKPAGANNSSTRALFYQRKLYDISYYLEQPGISGDSKKDYKVNFSYDEPNKSSENMYVFDMRDSDIYYGRLNNKSDEINLIENNLKQLPLQEDTLFALNFVVDAFNELKFDVENKYLSGEFQQEFYKELKPKAAWSNVLLSHHKHMEILYKKFIKYLNINYKNKNIINFNQYLQYFLYFIDSITPITCVNRTTYMLNRDVSPLCSGLAIDLENKPAGSDKYKYENFVTSYDYAIFRQTAIKYGFRVDKNIPWRLIFDINSTEAQKYINSYGMSGDNVYDNYYVKTQDYDIEVLKRYLLGFYNSYVEQNPEFSRAKFEYIDSELKTNIQLIQRTPETITSINLAYDEFFWIKLYCFIKLREYNVEFDQSGYNAFVKDISRDFKIGGTTKVFESLKKIKRQSEADKKNRSYFFVF